MSTEGRMRNLKSSDLGIIQPWFHESIDLRFMPFNGFIFECIEPWRDGRPLGVVWVLREGGVAYAYQPTTCPNLAPGTAAEVLAALLNFSASRSHAAGCACFLAATHGGELEDLLRASGFSNESPPEGRGHRGDDGR